MWTLMYWILYESVWKRCRFRFRFRTSNVKRTSAPPAEYHCLGVTQPPPAVMKFVLRGSKDARTSFLGPIHTRASWWNTTTLSRYQKSGIIPKSLLKTVFSQSAIKSSNLIKDVKKGVVSSNTYSSVYPCQWWTVSLHVKNTRSYDLKLSRQF